MTMKKMTLSAVLGVYAMGMYAAEKKPVDMCHINLHGVLQNTYLQAVAKHEKMQGAHLSTDERTNIFCSALVTLCDRYSAILREGIEQVDAFIHRPHCRSAAAIEKYETWFVAQFDAWRLVAAQLDAMAGDKPSVAFDWWVASEHPYYLSRLFCGFTVRDDQPIKHNDTCFGTLEKILLKLRTHVRSINSQKIPLRRTPQPFHRPFEPSPLRRLPTCD